MSGFTELISAMRDAAARLSPAAETLTATVADAASTGARAGILPVDPDRSTGALADSLTPVGPETADGISRSEIGSNLVYARIQNYGGTIVPNGHSGGGGLWLRWEAGGEVHFAKKVTLPAKHYMDEGAADGVDSLKYAADEFFTEVFG